jgi:pilus assembly protein Flp/PilA
MPPVTASTAPRKMHVKQFIADFCADTNGATAIEYGLIAGLIASACIAAFSNLGGNSTKGWQGVANKVGSNLN